MLDWVCRMYEVLLFAYPREFRARYGAEMRRVFREKARDVQSVRGYFGVARYCGSVAGDLAASVIRERSAEGSLVPLLIRFAALGCLAEIAAILWWERPHGFPFFGKGWLALYAVLSLLITAKRSWIRFSVARSTMYGLLGAGLCVAVTFVFFFTLPWFAPNRPAELMILMTPIAALGLWAAAGFQEARKSGSAFAGIVAGVWSSMASVLLHLALSLVFWEVVGLKFRSLQLFLPIPWNFSATTSMGITFGTISWLQWGVVIGLVMGIIGGSAGAWRSRTSLRLTW
jgi:hypothetical protein